MKLWRLDIADGKFGKHEGIALAWAETADDARQAVQQELSAESAYGQPFVVGDAAEYGDAQAHVVVVNWGE